MIPRRHPGHDKPSDYAAAVCLASLHSSWNTLQPGMMTERKFRSALVLTMSSLIQISSAMANENCRSESRDEAYVRGVGARAETIPGSRLRTLDSTPWIQPLASTHAYDVAKVGASFALHGAWWI